MKEVVLIWNHEENPVMSHVQEEDYTYIKLEAYAKQLNSGKPVVIFAYIENVLVEVTENNFRCLFLLPTPVFLEIEDAYEKDEVEEEGEDECQELDLNHTVHTMDLSSMNKTVSQGGSKWGKVEEAYLKNFHKYVVKRRIDKPDVEDLTSWISKRKASKSHLFGSRTTSAIITHYKLMVTRKDMADVRIKHSK